MKKLILGFSIATIIGFGFTGCATKYQSQGFTGGYEETQLSKNVFTVSFKGNGYTSSTRAKDFTLLRSAEVTLENGFKFFSIISADSSMSYMTTSSQYKTTGSVNNMGYVNLNTRQTGGMTFSKPSSSNTIVCFENEPSGQVSFDATFVAKSIKKKYDIE